MHSQLPRQTLQMDAWSSIPIQMFSLKTCEYVVCNVSGIYFDGVQLKFNPKYSNFHSKMYLYALSATHYSDVRYVAWRHKSLTISLIIERVVHTQSKAKFNGCISHPLGGGSPGNRTNGNSPHKWPVMPKAFPCHNVGHFAEASVW